MSADGRGPREVPSEGRARTSRGGSDTASTAAGVSAVLLDGGLSNALEDRGHDVSGALWTARLLRDAPQEIAAVHRSYYAAGARVATSSGYQASVDGFVAAGMGEREAKMLIASSVRIACDVRDELAADGISRWVAASVGPYGAARADGSEYRGRYGVSRSRLRDFHASRLQLLIDAGPDVLAIETIPDLDEAEVLVDLVSELGFPAWLSYSVDGGCTRAGQPLREAFALARESPFIVAAGVNCCTPADVLPAVRTAVEVTGLPAVAYPNSGESWDARGRRWCGRARFEPDAVRSWIDAGAACVGGCCRVGSDAIAALDRLLAPGPAAPPWDRAPTPAAQQQPDQQDPDQQGRGRPS